MQISGCLAAMRNQGGQRFGPMEAEYRAAARLGIEAIREARFYTGALIEKRQGSDMGGQIRRQPLAVFLGLDFHAD